MSVHDTGGPRRKPYVPPTATRPFKRVKYRKEKHKKEKVKRGPLFKFMIVFLSVLVPIGLILTAGVWAYSRIFGNPNLDQAQIQDRLNIDEVLRLPGIALGNDPAEAVSGIPPRTNFLVMGIDFDGQTSRTDTIMIGSFDSVFNELSIISIPRDTRITLSERTRATIPELRPQNLPGHSVRNGLPSIQSNMRINAIWHFFGPVYGPIYLINQIEEMLGVRIHYWASIDLQGFTSIIDTVGGVYFDVPQRMFYVYPEDGPDELGIQFTIDLHPGHQRLSGQQALDMVRFRATSDERVSRGYARGDLQRVEVQQNFMAYIIPQLLSRQAIAGNIFSYINIVADHIETNLQITDAFRYVGYLLNIGDMSINTYTIPIVQVAGGAVDIDPVPAHELVQRVFYRNPVRQDDEAANGNMEHETNGEINGEINGETDAEGEE